MTQMIVSQRSWWIAATILLCAGIGLAAAIVPPTFLVVAAAAYLLTLVVFWIKPDWAIYALLLASFCTAITIETGRVTLRPDQLVTIAIAPSILLMLLAGKRPVLTNLDFLILAYLFCNILSSLLNAPDLATSLQKCALLGVTFLAYFVTTHLLSRRSSVVKVIRLLIVVGLLEAIYGIVSVVLFTRGIQIGGAHAPFDDLYARGTFLEGNIFGSFEMIIALILLSFLFNNRFRATTGLILLSLVIVLVSLLMSFTRAAWIGFALGAIAYVLFFRRQWLQRLYYHLPLIVVACIVVAGIGYVISASLQIGSSNLFSSYLDKFRNLFEYKSGTGSLRLRVWVESLNFWTLHPFIGNGTDSIKALAVGTSMPKFGGDYWIPNSMLLALHDTGLIGFAVFCAIQILFLWNLRRAIKSTTNSYDRAVLEGFFISFIAVQFTYLFTNAFWLIFIWVFMGIGTMFAKHTMRHAVTGIRE